MSRLFRVLTIATTTIALLVGTFHNTASFHGSQGHQTAFHGSFHQSRNFHDSFHQSRNFHLTSDGVFHRVAV